MTISRWVRYGLAWVLACWLVSAQAANQSMTQQASGYGDTPQMAVGNALVNAARQALGVVVTLDPDFRKQTMEWVIRQSDNGNVITQRWSDVPAPRLPTHAGITRYQVLSLKQADKLWHAKVEAEIAKTAHLRPHRDELFSLVVLPFSTEDTSYSLHQPVAARVLSRQLHRALVEDFTQTGQIRVLDRLNSRALNAERNIAAASLSPQEQVKVGQKLGGDLLLTGHIERFQLGRPGVAYYGNDNYSMALYTRIRYRLVEVATGDILFADTFTYEPPASTLTRAMQAQHISSLDGADRLGEVIYPAVSRALVNQVLSRVMPLRLLKIVDANTLFISQGSGRLAVGDTLAVVRNWTLHADGRQLAAQQKTDQRLVVTQVAPGYAIAKLTQGTLGQLQAGAEVVPVTAEAAIEAKAPTHPMTPGSSAAPLTWD